MSGLGLIIVGILLLSICPVAMALAAQRIEDRSDRRTVRLSASAIFGCFLILGHPFLFGQTWLAPIFGWMSIIGLLAGLATVFAVGRWLGDEPPGKQLRLLAIITPMAPLVIGLGIAIVVV